ncbi:MAG: phage tail protein [Myxococcales bacterium]|nr:phage tail protein [Myxococcales bacterium]
MILERAKREPFKVQGVVIGLVVDNKDPDGHYRVKVKFPWVLESDAKYTDAKDDEDFRTTWCRIATFMAGKDRGAFWLPEVDDEVLIAFEHGDVRRPFMIGALWNGVDTPIHANQEQSGKNWFRSIRSRSGHMLQFVDKKDDKIERVILQTLVQPKDEEKDPKQRNGHWIALDQSGSVDQIEIYDHTQEHYILIDTKNKKITIECKTGDMLIKAKKTITIDCKDLVIKASNTIKQESGAATETKAGATMAIKSSSTMTVKGSTINLN